MRPRVLIWRSELLPPSETFIAAQAAALRRYDPVYCGLKATTPSLDLEPPVVRPRYWSKAQRWVALEIGQMPFLERSARAHEPVLMHAHFATDACAALPLARRLQLPLVVTLHGYDVMRTNAACVSTREGRRYLAQRYQLFEYASVFVCVSEAIRRAALLRGFPARKLRVLPIGLDPALYPFRVSVPPQPVVAFVGRLVRKKGCDVLLHAMHDVQRELPGARLVVAGEGPERAALEAQARAQTEGTVFLGRQINVQVRALLAQARCLAAPSCTAADGDSEGLPTVLMEAMASGVPVASTLHSGIPELVTHDEAGLLSPERSVEMLARHLVRLCTEDALCARMAAAGRARIERSFRIEEQTRHLEEIYDEAVQRQSHRQVRQQPVLVGTMSGHPIRPGAAVACAGTPSTRTAQDHQQVTASAAREAETHEPRLRLQAAWLLSGNGASMVFQALAFVVIGRMLGSREYGAFVGAVALVNVLAQFSSLGMDMVVLRTVARDRAAFAATWFRALVIAGLGALVLMGAVTAYGRLFLPPVVRPLLVFLVLADGLFGRVTQMASRALQACGLTRWCAKLLAATNAARCMAAAALLAVCAQQARAVTLTLWVHVYAGASFSVAVLAVVIVTRLLGRPARAPITGKDLLEGLSFSFSSSAISIYNDIDKTVLMQHGMFYAAGVYGAAYRIIDVASAPILALFGAASPRLFRGGAGGAAALRPETRRLLRWAVPCGLGIAAFLALGAPVIPRLFGPSFAESVIVLRWLCLLPLLRGLHYAWGTAITACASQWLRTTAQASVAVGNLLLNLWLIPKWGWHAAAGISLASDGALALLSWLLLRTLAQREGVRAGRLATLPTGLGAAPPTGSLFQ